MPVFDYTLGLWRALFPAAGMGWTPYTATWFGFATVLCVGLSSLTYRWIERPFLERKARLDAGTPATPARTT